MWRDIWLEITSEWIKEKKTPAFLFINKLTIFHSIYYFFSRKEKRKVTDYQIVFIFLCVYTYTFNILTFFFQTYFHSIFIYSPFWSLRKQRMGKNSKFFFFNTNKTFFICDGNTYYWENAIRKNLQHIIWAQAIYICEWILYGRGKKSKGKNLFS